MISEGVEHKNGETERKRERRGERETERKRKVEMARRRKRERERFTACFVNNTPERREEATGNL